MLKGIILVFVLSCATLVCHTQTLNDMANLQKYDSANRELLLSKNPGNRIVFIGNSITEGWANLDPHFFSSNNYVGRGISGQTSPQLLMRFRQDVIDLKPVAVVIHIRTNDIAENTGKYDLQFTLGNIKSMAELAQANGIRPILSSVLPVREYPWRKGIKNVPTRIDELNVEIKKYAQANGFSYADYNKAMRDSTGAMIESLAYDGVHPNIEGFKIMEGIVKKAIDNE